MIQIDFWKILCTLMKLIKTLFENGKIEVNDKKNLIPKIWSYLANNANKMINMNLREQKVY